MAHDVVHFEIAGRHVELLRRFYAELFGWTVDADNPMQYGVVLPSEGGIGGGIMESEDGSSRVTIYVSSEDIGNTLRRAVELGAQVVQDVVQVEGGPTIATFRDPSGNVIGLVQGSPGQAPPPAGGGDPVTWFEIAGRQAEPTIEFYRQLFGWRIDANNPMHYGEYHADGGASGGIFGGMGDPRVTFYTTVADLEERLARVNRLGGRTLMGPEQVPGGPTIAMFADPAGNVVGMILAPTTGSG